MGALVVVDGGPDYVQHMVYKNILLILQSILIMLLVYWTIVSCHIRSYVISYSEHLTCYH